MTWPFAASVTVPPIPPPRARAKSIPAVVAPAATVMGWPFVTGQATSLPGEHAAAMSLRAHSAPLRSGREIGGQSPNHLVEGEGTALPPAWPRVGTRQGVATTSLLRSVGRARLLQCRVDMGRAAGADPA